MKQRFDIMKRNAEARATIKTIENQLFYGEKRLEAMWRGVSDARKAGDKERENLLYRGWKKEHEAVKDLKSRKQELLILVAEKKYANQYLYSDVNPWEVIEEKSPVRIVVRAMRCQIKPEARKALQESFVPGGFLGHFDNAVQEWDISPDKDGMTIELRKHKDGRWYEAGSRSCPFILSTEPFKRYDYNF